MRGIFSLQRTPSLARSRDVRPRLEALEDRLLLSGSTTLGPMLNQVLSTLGLAIIPCVLLMQYKVFRDRQRKLAALSEAIANSLVQPAEAVNF